MKSIGKIFLSFSILFLFAIGSLGVLAQTESTQEPTLTNNQVATNQKFEDTKKLYLLKLEEYKNAKSSFEIAKAQYLKSKTQKSLSDAMAATMKFVEVRDEVIILYLELVKLKLELSKGLEQSKINSLTFKIDQEIEWFQNHKNLVSSALTLGDLVNDSQKASQEYTLVEKISYETLGYISYGNLTESQKRFKDLLDRSKTKVDLVKREKDKNLFSPEKIERLDRWILEIDNLLLRTGEKFSETDATLSQLSKAKLSLKPSNIYIEAISSLLEARQLLKRGGSVLDEVLSEIKIKS